MRKIAITGGTGFIGRLLVNTHLSKGDEVRVLSRRKDLGFDKSVVVFEGGLSDKPLLHDFLNGVDILYHCAAELKDAGKMYETNVLGTQNLIEAAKGNIKKWVQLSSTGIYGAIFSGVVTEFQKPKPNNDYEKTKYRSDVLVTAAGKSKSFQYTIIRPSNVFGKEMTNKSIYQLIRLIDSGKFFFIGRPGANANYISVENVVNALMLASDNSASNGLVFNVSDSTTIESFVNSIRSFLGKPKITRRLFMLPMRLLGYIGDLIPRSPFHTNRLKALTTRVYYSTEKIESLLEYKSVKSIDDTLGEMVKKYQSSKAAL